MPAALPHARLLGETANRRGTGVVLARVLTCAVVGLEGAILEVQVDIALALPGCTIAGLPDAAVVSWEERTRTWTRRS